ncbi:MAG TPA: FtsX-like permease family protein [Mycobacteriales bacterium]
MYPELTLPLVVLAGAALGYVATVVVRQPVSRRLALRQVTRRPAESLLVVLGAVLGTALLVASLAVGDSLNRSVRQSAYEVLGPIDEYVRTTDPALGAEAARRLEALRGDPRVDGLLTVRGDQVAAERVDGTGRRAEPRALVWELDFAAAARFGTPTPSGIDVADPGPGGAVLNRHLADSLRAAPGDAITVFAYGKPLRLTVRAVVPAEGLAGMGIGAAVNRDAFVTPGTLAAAAAGTSRAPTTTTLVSNAGDVENGVAGTDEVTGRIRAALGGLAGRGTEIATVKREVLDAADEAGAVLGSLFLFIASFSIVAGIMLLMNIFVMLADERRGQLGMLRAVGMRRRRVTAGFAVEASIYTGLAAILGAVLGVVIARAVVGVAVNILNGFATGDQRLTLVFAVTPRSIVNGVAAGFVISFLAVVLTSVRIARQNVIAAIRDLDVRPPARQVRRAVVVSAVATVLLAAVTVPVVVEGRNGALTYLLPALTAFAAVPLLRTRLGARAAYTTVAGVALAWGLLANIARPAIYDTSSTATYIVLGCLLSGAAVVLVSMNQDVLLRPLRAVVERPGEAGLAARLAIAYPTARRFRTGATLAMYAVVTLVIVLLIQISAIVDAGVSDAVAKAAGTSTLRVDFSRSAPLPDPAADLTRASGGAVTAVTPMITATADGADPLGRATRPLPVLAIGVPAGFAAGAPEIRDRLSTLDTSADAWRLVERDPRYVLLDNFYGSSGGPQGKAIAAGTTLPLTDTRTGKITRFVVAGLIDDATAFYGIDPGEQRWPVVMSTAAARTAFGSAAAPTTAFARTAPGTDLAGLRTTLQGDLLANGVVVTDLRARVEAAYTANRQLFRLMQGYLALGLLVGITGLGVIMVRAVRERRRTIGVLRALGVRASTVRRSFLAESTFIAVEGVAIGTVLGVLTTWVLYTNSPAFGTLTVPFPIAWTAIAVTVGATLVASLLVTAAPARRAARIRPAVAVRVAD